MSAEAKHTPGPWRLHAPTGLAATYVVRNGSPVADTNFAAHSIEECLANARLIAAAPDGYALAGKIRAIAETQTGLYAPWAVPTSEEWSEVVHLAKVFFAKAEGKE